ncbi:hypothetical protein CLOP_g17586 [Closterium sp. NIES-67]|nr:hypothetical protein CLOP_g17586 [Closterium sp. NIES-67]
MRNNSLPPDPFGFQVVSEVLVDELPSIVSSENFQQFANLSFSFRQPVNETREHLSLVFQFSHPSVTCAEIRKCNEIFAAMS